MFAVVALVLAGLASAQAFSACTICAPLQFPGKEYCCYDYNDSPYCCSAEDYYKGGFLNQQNLIILIGVGLVVLASILLFICCCCCSCCPCYRRRRQGAVYNSVSVPPAYNLSTPTYYPPQYPAQHPANPYIVPNASAPAYPTLPASQP